MYVVNKNKIPINKPFFFKEKEAINKTVLNNYEENFIKYIISIYGGQYYVKDGYLYMLNCDDMFYVNLNDKVRFGKYIIFHKNKRDLNGISMYHKQGIIKSLDLGMFECFTHSFNKNNGIWGKYDDFKKFKNEFLNKETERII